MTARRSSPAPRIALALAGGGPLGAIYEIGALCALDDTLDGLNLNACDHYIGVSAGGFIAAALANGITPRELCESFIEGRPRFDGFDPAWLMRPAWGEFAQRLRALPQLASGAAWSWLVEGKAFSQAIERLGAALPTGVLDNEAIHT
jgi:NTE family protein